MKTRTELRKTAVRTAAVIVSFILVSFTVSAQEFWKKLLTNSSFNEIAIAMVEPVNAVSGNESSKTVGTDWKNFDMAFDPALELEGWMSSGDHFGLNAVFGNYERELPVNYEASLLNLDCSADVTAPLSLEDWMVQDGLWIK